MAIMVGDRGSGIINKGRLAANVQVELIHILNPPQLKVEGTCTPVEHLTILASIQYLSIPIAHGLINPQIAQFLRAVPKHSKIC